MAGLVATLPAGAAPAGAESRLEGFVLRTRVTLCQFKPRGCAGYMELASDRHEPRARWLVQVRLGVPIRRGDDYVLLASLGGARVSVVHVNERGAIIARSIEVSEEPAR